MVDEGLACRTIGESALYTTVRANTVYQPAAAYASSFVCDLILWSVLASTERQTVGRLQHTSTRDLRTFHVSSLRLYSALQTARTGGSDGTTRRLGPQYASAFQEPSVADAYAFRPPYPPAVFDVLTRLLPATPQRLLDVGCGADR